MAIKLHADSYSQADVFLPRDGAVNVIPHNKNDGLAVEGLLLESGSGNLVGGLPLQDIKHLQGAGALQLPLDTSGLAPGSYTLRLRTYDGEGSLQGSQRIELIVGAADLSITELRARPRPVRPGGDVQLGATVRNSGGTAVNGNLNLTVRNEQGDLVATFSHPFGGLAPGEIFSAQDTASGSLIGTGPYRLVATAVFDGRAEQEVLPLSYVEVHDLYLPVVSRP